MEARTMLSCLLFSLDGVRYGVDAQSVLEIVWLPELTPVEEAPHYIAGVINRRGKIEPVINLGLRLGHPPRRHHVKDSIVMLQADDVIMGMIVGEVTDVVRIPASAIESPPHYDGEPPGHIHFLAGEARLDEEIVMLLDVQRLLHAPALPVSGAIPNADTCFCPDASDEERAIFRSRAHNLMQVDDSRDADALISLSIIQLGEERFGVELDLVREFSHLSRVTPIPCSPPHIAGNMNLRGDILTLVDIRGRLNISLGSTTTEIMVIESGELSIGVPVDMVLEVIRLQPADIAPLPAAHEEKHEYCKGVARYGEAMVSILDVQKLLTQGGLEVEEEV